MGVLYDLGVVVPKRVRAMAHQDHAVEQRDMIPSNFHDFVSFIE